MTALENSNALVLGANGLIGSAITRALAAAGAQVTIAGRDGSRLRELEEALRVDGLECSVTVAEVTDDGSVARLVDDLTRDRPLDIAINNVGVSHRPAPLAELELSEFDRVIAVTLRGVAVAMKYELASMTAGGSLVNIASSAGLDGAPGMSAYVAAKHGVIGLTKTAAIDYARRGIRVNAVAPGPIESGPIMHQPAEVRGTVGQYVPLGRMGRPDEVASAALWLASPASSYTTGAVLTVDGGKRA